MADLIAYACPHCGQPAEITPEPAARLFSCPACGEAFIVAAEDGSTDLPEESTDSPYLPEEELSALRIHQLAAGRRATYRARSYCLIATIVCVVCIVQLIWMTVQHIRKIGWTSRPMGYLLFILLAFVAAVHFARRSMELHREAKHSALSEPPSSPDFSTLDDGSKRWKNLEDVR